MTSELEKIPDRLLFQLIKQLDKNCEINDISLDYTFSDEVLGAIDDTIKIFGIVDSPSYFDEEFLWVTAKMNRGILSEEKLSGSLIRPQLQEYSFNSEVSERVYQTTTWVHNIESYGNPFDLITAIDQNGDFDYWSGMEDNLNVNDIDFESMEIVGDSFRKI